MKRWVNDLHSTKFDGKSLAPYKGYQIEKNWEIDYKGRRIPKTDRYMVVDEDDDWIGDVYKTLAEAKSYIDSITSEKSIRSASNVTASKKSSPKAWKEFSAWYDALTAEQRNRVDDIADEEGLPVYEECTDDALQWIIDEAEVVFKFEGLEKSTDMIPDTLSYKPVVFILNSVNSTYNDDILEAAEKFGAIKVKYGMLDDDGTYFSPDKCSWRFAVPSKKVAQDIFDYVKKSRIPVNQKNITTAKVDWSKAYQIYVDDYSDGTFKMEYHANAPKKNVKGGTGVGGRTVYYLVDYPDTEPIRNLDTGARYCFDSEEEAQAFIDSEDFAYWRDRYPGVRPWSKRIYSVWHD